MKGGAYLRNTLFRNPSEFKRSLRFLAFPNYQLSSNGPFCKIFTYWREKMWVFLAWTTTANWFKVCWPVTENEINHITSQTVFHVTREVAHNLFSLRAQRDTSLFHWKIDWQLNELSARAFILYCCIIKKTTWVVKKISPALTFRTCWFVHLDILYTFKEERRKQVIKEGKCISIGMTHI